MKTPNFWLRPFGQITQIITGTRHCFASVAATVSFQAAGLMAAFLPHRIATGNCVFGRKMGVGNLMDRVFRRVGYTRYVLAAAVAGVTMGVTAMPAGAQVSPDQISNFETAHVAPLAVVPGQDAVLAVNTPNGSIERFAVTGTTLRFETAIKVGLEPVSVRARTATEAWVVNALSDSVSIVDLSENLVTQTLQVCDQPADVAFAGGKAFVSCAGAEKVAVFDAASPGAPLSTINILGEQPRMMTVSGDGSEIYLGIFESGNGTTVLTAKNNRHETNLVGVASSPYGGVNPPPNDGDVFNPPLNPNNVAPSNLTSMIVRRTAAGDWLDDNGVSWREQITGGTTNTKDRLAGWDLVDRDIAIINVADETVQYKGQGLNIVMALAVHPVSYTHLTLPTNREV